MKKSFLNKNNAMQQALKRRQTSSLPSNFSHKMMQQIYREEQKLLRRNTRLRNIGLTASSVGLIALAMVCIWWYTGINQVQLDILYVDMLQNSSSWIFYTYIFLLLSLLLGLDFLFRRWYMKKKGYY